MVYGNVGARRPETVGVSGVVGVVRGTVTVRVRVTALGRAVRLTGLGLAGTVAVRVTVFVLTVVVLPVILARVRILSGFAPGVDPVTRFVFSRRQASRRPVAVFDLHAVLARARHDGRGRLRLRRVAGVGVPVRPRRGVTGRRRVRVPPGFALVVETAAGLFVRVFVLHVGPAPADRGRQRGDGGVLVRPRRVRVPSEIALGIEQVGRAGGRSHVGRFSPLGTVRVRVAAARRAVSGERFVLGRRAPGRPVRVAVFLLRAVRARVRRVGRLRHRRVARGCGAGVPVQSRCGGLARLHAGGGSVREPAVFVLHVVLRGHGHVVRVLADHRGCGRCDA